MGSKPVHWAGDLSGWVTSDRRNVLPGCPQQGYQFDADGSRKAVSNRAESQLRYETLLGEEYQKSGLAVVTEKEAAIMVLLEMWPCG